MSRFPRKIVSHIAKTAEGTPVCLLNSRIEIYATGVPGPGGASQEYAILQIPDGILEKIRFHAGNPAEGVSGWSNEVLLAIVMDRLGGFQKGPFACEANAIAREHVCKALETLKDRTIERALRGVAGTLQK